MNHFYLHPTIAAYTGQFKRNSTPVTDARSNKIVLGQCLAKWSKLHAVQGEGLAWLQELCMKSCLLKHSEYQAKSKTSEDTCI